MEKHQTHRNDKSKDEELAFRKQVGIGSSSDRLRRDEWSEGAVSSLLDAYEAKWVLRNRTKLKGQDWEDVARHVSSRANETRSPKTMTQCKNKIESMKKRYRSESVSADASSWPLFPRLHLLLSCRAPPPLMLLDPPPPPPPPLPPSAPSPPPAAGTLQNSPGINGVVAIAEENGVDANEGLNNIAMETDSSTPTYNGGKETPRKRKKKKMNEEGKSSDWDLAESVQWLAEVFVRCEKTRIDTMRELERIRSEADAKKGEMDLKRTEIIAKTQLEIARLLVGKDDEDVNSSLKVGRN